MSVAGSEVSRRSVFAGPVVAAVTLLAALVATHEAGVTLRDPAACAARAGPGTGSLQPSARS